LKDLILADNALPMNAALARFRQNLEKEVAEQ
jgi:hypothetical protein